MTVKQLAPRCNRQDCKLDGVGALSIRVPLAGIPRAMQNPPRVIIGLSLCQPHFDEVKVKDFLDANLRRIFELQQKAGAYPVGLDFDSAYTALVQFHDPEYQALLRQRELDRPNRN